MNCFDGSCFKKDLAKSRVLLFCGAFVILLVIVATLLLGNTSFHYTPTVSFLNDRARDITGATAVNVSGFIVPEGLTGNGQIVAIADSGLDAGNINDLHPDLQSSPGKMPKVVMLRSLAGRDVPDDPDGHGTHMAATVAGTGAASEGKFRGVAPEASIYFQSILNESGEAEPPKNLVDLFWPAYSAGSRVHVDGWGGGPNAYQEAAAQIDEFVRTHPDFLPVFGAGNAGPSAGSITSEANSKNALVVGASNLSRPAMVSGVIDPCSPDEFSSRGPAGDGRIKPELLAPASAVISARSRLVKGNLPGYPEYTCLQGTSMAAAVAGGSIALLREYFKEYSSIANPSAALLKAVLINGARPLSGGSGRDGFGVIDLAGTVIALQEGIFMVKEEAAGISQGSESTYTFHVLDSSTPFKATLVWSDPPADPGRAQALINDLNLMVRTPDGKVFYGNHFLGNNLPDRINNVEQVYLNSPVPGDYTVQVYGQTIHRNVVAGNAEPSQDYALVWGQPAAQNTVAEVAGPQVALADDTSIGLNDVSVNNLINDSIAPVDAEHLFPGAAVFRTPEKVYVAARLWRAVGVKALNIADSTIFTEIDPNSRTGGYILDPAGGLQLNGKAAVPGELPAGIEISAVINPVNQTIRQAHVAYSEREGVVAAVHIENGQKTLYLAGNGGAFRVSPVAAYFYEDRYTDTSFSDMPFATGALDELEEIMPGMPVRLHLAPSTGEVQYLAVKRWVALGTVRETVASTGEVRLENGTTYRLFPGAPIKKDRESTSFEKIKPGDHVTAILLTDTGEAIGLVAYSNVLYGKVVDFTRKDRMLYFINENGHYCSLYLHPDAVIYRWGIKTTVDAITAESRIRVTTDPGGKEVWRLDLAETFITKSTLTDYNQDTGTITTAEGRQYRISELTSVYKNDYPVLPGVLLPGEKVELEYAVAPQPTGYVLFSVNARSNAPPPVFLSSAINLQGRLGVTGRAGDDAEVYLWKGSSVQVVPVDNYGGFGFSCPAGNGDDMFDFILVAVNRQTGGVAGRKIAGNGWSDRDGVDMSTSVVGLMTDVLKDTTPAEDVNWTDAPITRLQIVVTLASLLNWSGASESLLSFNDMEAIPLALHPAVAEAVARGVIRGYPDGSFLPQKTLTRAEAAVVFAAVLSDLGVGECKQTTGPYYADSGDFPPWAGEAIAKTTAKGLFCGRPPGSFVPEEPVTIDEVRILVERLMFVCFQLTG
ncbi:MAG: S8 family serine peptidase [Desulfotomaculaceae bacterium]|nr:S8 family serine peptidase [Desulfotomaculaceae bacterium]